MTKNIDPRKKQKARAGHQEIQGETIAKFEFFDYGYNPYSRYLDEDKIDLILRKKEGNNIIYKEIQVKYGRLYECTPKWESKLFDFTSWKFFKAEEFKNASDNLFVAYVLSFPEGYRGDIFIFPAKEFNQIISSAIERNTKKGIQYCVYFSRSLKDGKWYLRKKSKFDKINNVNTLCIERYRRNFDF